MVEVFSDRPQGYNLRDGYNASRNKTNIVGSN